MLEQFLSRIPAKAPARVAEDVTVAFKIVDTFKSRAATVKTGPALSAIGKKQALGKILQGGPLGHLKQLREHAAGELAALAKQRETLKARALTEDMPPAELRQETRTWLRSLTHADRLRAIKSDDPLVKAAIATAPAFLSGLDPELWKHVTEKLVAQKFSEHLEQIEVLEEGYETAQAALTLASDDIRRECGMEQAEFAALAA